MEANKQIKKDRYFIVFYLGNIGSGQANGHMNITVSDGGYLNKLKTLKMIENGTEGLTSVVLKNIIELNELDFKHWNSN